MQFVVKETVIQRVCVLTHGSDCSVEAEPPSAGCQRGKMTFNIPDFISTTMCDVVEMNNITHLDDLILVMRSASGSDELSQN